MNNETKLTAADLALYLGCEVEWFGEKGYILTGINTGQSNFNPIGLLHVEADIPVWAGDEVKPILRPLSDMTEEELLEFAKICSGTKTVYSVASAISNYKNVVCVFENEGMERLVMNDMGETWYAHYFGGEGDGTRNTIKQHEQTRYLLSKHFDLFGWIEAGLAIDKTKTVTP